MAESAWRPDPTGQHESRYWDGSKWTEHVADRGVASVDPPTHAAAGAFPPPAPAGSATQAIPPSPPTMAAPAALAAPVAATGQPATSNPWFRRRGAWVGGVALVALIAIVAVIATRDSDSPTASGGAGSGGQTGGGDGAVVRAEFTDGDGYQYVVEHSGPVSLQRNIENASPGFAVVNVVGGTMSVVNATPGRNAPMPSVHLIAYVALPECDTDGSVIQTKVSTYSVGCLLEVSSAWNRDAVLTDDYTIDSGDELQAGQTLTAAVDESWFPFDRASTVPDTVDVGGSFVWGIEVSDDDPFGPSSCVIRLVSDNAPLVRDLIDEVAQINRSEFDTVLCDVAAA